MIRQFVTSSSSRTFQEHIVVKACSGNTVGWGECASPMDPYYSEETTKSCWYMLRDFLVPAVLGKSLDSISDLVNSYRKVRRNNFAKSGLEMAVWDIFSKEKGTPIHKLLGGTRKEILSGVSLGIEQDINRLLGLIQKYLNEGYRRIKLKIAPSRDVEIIRMIRDRYPAIPLMVDANSAYSLRDTPTLKKLDSYNLMMIEQPLGYDDVIDHAKLQKEISTPICLDESITSLDQARIALDLGSCSIINIKVSRLGGLFESKKVHDLCVERHVPVWCGGMHEFGIGRAANIAISSLPGFNIPGDISGSDKYYIDDIVDPAIRATKGAIVVPSGPGLGFVTSEKRIIEHTVKQTTVVAK